MIDKKQRPDSVMRREVRLPHDPMPDHVMAKDKEGLRHQQDESRLTHRPSRY